MIISLNAKLCEMLYPVQGNAIIMVSVTFIQWLLIYLVDSIGLLNNHYHPDVATMKAVTTLIRVLF